jgi:hypothetical protein
MGGVRARKNTLVLLVRAYLTAGLLTPEQAHVFETMFRRCRTPGEQDQVRSALRTQLDGWKDESDRFAKVLQIANDFGEEADDDEDPPALREALAKSRIRLGKA